MVTRMCHSGSRDMYVSCLLVSFLSFNILSSLLGTFWYWNEPNRVKVNFTFMWPCIVSRIRMERSSILILLASCQKTCMTHTIAVCTVKISWRWTKELSETCTVSFQNKFEKLVHLLGFITRMFRWLVWPSSGWWEKEYKYNHYVEM